MDRHNMMAGSRFWEQPVQTETGCGSLQDPDKQAMCQQATVAGPGGRQTHGRQVRDRDTDRPNMQSEVKYLSEGYGGEGEGGQREKEKRKREEKEENGETCTPPKRTVRERSKMVGRGQGSPGVGMTFPLKSQKHNRWHACYQSKMDVENYNGTLPYKSLSIHHRKELPETLLKSLPGSPKIPYK